MISETRKEGRKEGRKETINQTNELFCLDSKVKKIDLDLLLSVITFLERSPNLKKKRKTQNKGKSNKQLLC